jgi:hypothetical protein
VLGDKGSLIGYHGVWRNVDLQSIDALAIPQEEVDSVFLNLKKDVKIKEFNSSLGYYQLPPLPLTSSCILFMFTALPPSLMVNTYPCEWSHYPEQNSVHLSRKPRIDRHRNPYQAVRKTHRVSSTNSTTDGWTNNFNRGDVNAWESDWRRNDHNWVNTTDFVFYTGHANINGWVLAPPDDKFLDFNKGGPEWENPGDLWGPADLDWMVACGRFLHDIGADKKK